MRSILVAVIAFGFALVSGSPSNSCPSTTAEEAKKSEAVLSDLAVNFFKHVSSADQEKNAVMSPVSLALALALLESGSAGRTRDALRRVLTGSEANNDVLTAYPALQKQLGINEEKTKLSIANAVFPQEEVVLRGDYVTAVETCFGNEIEKVDYRGQLEQTRQKINKWVSDKTVSKIPELFKPGVLGPDVALVLANAIYFKGSWNSAFSPADTKAGNFYRLGRERDAQNVQFMSQAGRFGYFSDDKLEALELDYSSRDLAMYILLPKAMNGLRALEQELTGEKLKSIVNQADAQPKYMKINLPKFTIRSSLDLADTLNKLDLGIIFSDRADFGRMTDAALKVSKAVHEAFINVHENGTEAAAATGFSIKFRSSPPRNPPEFNVDHPFLYVIKHKPTGAFIFLGKVNFIENEN